MAKLPDPHRLDVTKEANNELISPENPDFLAKAEKIQAIWAEIEALLTQTENFEPYIDNFTETSKNARNGFVRFVEARVDFLAKNRESVPELKMFKAGKFLHGFSELPEYKSISQIVALRGDALGHDSVSGSGTTIEKLESNDNLRQANLRVELGPLGHSMRRTDKMNLVSIFSKIPLDQNEELPSDRLPDILLDNADYLSNLSIGEAIKRLNNSFWLVEKRKNRFFLLDFVGLPEELVKNCIRCFVLKDTNLTIKAYLEALEKSQNESNPNDSENEEIYPLEMFDEEGHNLLSIPKRIEKLKRIHRSYEHALSLFETGTVVKYQEKFKKSKLYRQKKDFYSVGISSNLGSEQETSPTGKKVIPKLKVVSRFSDGKTTILTSSTLKNNFEVTEVELQSVPTRVKSYDNKENGYYIDGNTPIIDPIVIHHLDSLWKAAENPDFDFSPKSSDPHQNKLTSEGEASKDSQKTRPWSQIAIKENLNPDDIKLGELTPLLGLVNVNIFPNNLIVEPDLSESATFVVENNEKGWAVIRTKSREYIRREASKDDSDPGKDKAIRAWVKHPPEDNEHRASIHVQNLRKWAN